jgi:2-keto-3-deoxy-L-fuconate dehydrogenase
VSERVFGNGYRKRPTSYSRNLNVPNDGEQSLAQKVAIITNCGLLQGGPIAAEFQRQGATLILQTTNLERARPILVRDGVELGGSSKSPPVRFVEADFSRPGVAEANVDELAQEYGRIDALVNNNAPEHIGKPLHEIEDSEWEDMYRLVVTELFYTTRAVLRRMIPKRRGKILNVAAAGGINPYPGPYTAYCSARGAVITLTKALGREVAPFNIQVNAIAQNWVKNPSYFTDAEISTPQFQEKLERRVPAGRLAEPWEQAKLAAFLVSEDSNFLCGTVIPFAGGEVL